MSDTPNKTGDTKGRGPGDWLQAKVVLSLLWFLRLLPYPKRVAVGGWLFQHVLAPVAGHRKRIRDNLALVWSDLPRDRVEGLVRQVPNFVGRTVTELFSPRDFSEVARQAPVTGPGLAVLEECKTAGRPVILVSGHFGNYDVVRAGLGARGFEIGALYRPMDNRYFNDAYLASILQIGAPLFPRGREGMADMVRFLKRGGALAVLIDQHMRQGEPLTFFNKTAMTATSTAKLAIKYDAPIVPFYSIRQPDGLSFELVLEAPVEKGTAEEMTQALNDSLEARVRANPEQWLWSHRRWKGAK
ncbi:lauroyl acyltransferase [Loktanella sp. IMCC34160]|uniref:lysophospholipid acyltransferase family protein n=1 Tax=Loktanella sp. IMCC34160 TaxID=2510646 RepID=UPI00101DE3C7|nr:lysophospholipid acyltransferase family protein [Loktanella sp. IMCC34160]RYG91540.1 lauroyl acyltransferase [Loktanella sp. IMCC34160]